MELISRQGNMERNWSEVRVRGAKGADVQVHYVGRGILIYKDEILEVGDGRVWLSGCISYPIRRVRILGRGKNGNNWPLDDSEQVGYDE